MTMYEFRERERRLVNEDVDQYPETHAEGVENSDHAPRKNICELCGRIFRQRSGLKIHYNTHSREKPHLCGTDGCTSKFGDPSSCTRHRKEVHGARTVYSCPHLTCKTQIKRRSAYKRHLKDKHGLSPSPADLDGALHTLFDAESNPPAGQGSPPGNEHGSVTGSMTFVIDSHIPPLVHSTPLETFSEQSEDLGHAGSSLLFSDSFFTISDRDWTPQLLPETSHPTGSSPNLGGPSHTSALSLCIPDVNYLRPMDAFNGGRSTSLSPEPSNVGQNSPSYTPMAYVQPRQRLFDFFGVPQVQQHHNPVVPPLLPTDSFYDSSSSSTPSLSDSAAPSPYPAAPSPYPAAPSPYPAASSPYPAAPSPYPIAPSPQSMAADLTLLQTFFNEHTASLQQATRHNSPGPSTYMPTSYTHTKPTLKRKADSDDGFEASRRVRSRIV